MNKGNTILLHNKTECTFTQVSNTFIDEYMPDANGTYVKVYLTLLRLISDSRVNISIEGIADALDLTGKHVTKALSYWEKKGLLVLSRNDTGDIKDITFNTPVKNAEDCAEVKTDEPAVKDINSYTAEDINRITSSEDFIWITNIIEKYMQRTLTPTDIDLVVYLYDSLKFSSDLIFHLYEYCIDKGKKNSKYIQAVALNWAKEGIDTVDKAVTHSTAYDSNYMQIMKTFGLNQPPAPAQKKYIDTWLSYGYDPSMICEACSRTVIATGGANFKYANGIIDHWKKNGIKTPEDLKIADNIHSVKTESVRSGPAPKSQNAKNSFNSYEQRNYTTEDYVSLEQSLLKN